ncbi:lasso peptide biosynthesis B2 protein [Sphingomonas sp. LT1P40]|uniref:lasso peptide biosynthesis B2 protein n=1 Tax=Alteristakelama amylovorans TaxID=3096166 RepID=UPI002FC5AACB
MAEAAATLAAASLAIGVLRFRRVAAMAGGDGTTRAGEQAELVRMGWAVEAAARRVPWRTVCFQKGLAVHWMLRRRRIASTLCYGVRQSADKGVEAHVWVVSGDREVIGCEIADQFGEVARFPRRVVRSEKSQ